MGNSQQTRIRIINAVYGQVAREGVEKVTIARIAAAAGLSEGIIYRHFENKSDLLKQAFLQICREINRRAASVDLTEKDLKESLSLLWNSFLDYLLENPDKLQYYVRFLHSGYCTREIYSFQVKLLSSVADLVEGKPGSFRQMQDELVWVFVLEPTLGLAVHVCEGRIVMCEEVRQEALGVLTRGLILEE